eukprot:764231-Hanusia_phi.AAC.6
MRAGIRGKLPLVFIVENFRSFLFSLPLSPAGKLNARDLKCLRGSKSSCVAFPSLADLFALYRSIARSSSRSPAVFCSPPSEP